MIPDDPFISLVAPGSAARIQTSSAHHWESVMKPATKPAMEHDGRWSTDAATKLTTELHGAQPSSCQSITACIKDTFISSPRRSKLCPKKDRWPHQRKIPVGPNLIQFDASKGTTTTTTHRKTPAPGRAPWRKTRMPSIPSPHSSSSCNQTLGMGALDPCVQ